MSFTAKDVSNLREKTGCGMMACKQALTEANGDFNKAIDILREKGVAAAAKKAERIAAEGIVAAIVKPEQNVGAIIEVNSETDFVARNADFVQFVNECANVVINQNPADIESLLTCSLDKKTVDAVLKEKILVIGENIKIRRFKRFEGNLYSYIHGDGRIGVMVKFNADKSIVNSEDFACMTKDIAMQIAAANPTYLNKEAVEPEVLEKEKQILMTQAINEGKPQNIAEKMVNGRISKYYKENCLVEQEFIKDPDISVQNYIDSVAKKLSTQISVADFVRFEKGEGIEKREDNFAEEVANMIK